MPDWSEVTVTGWPLRIAVPTHLPSGMRCRFCTSLYPCDCSRDVTPAGPLPVEPPAIDEDALRDAAKRLGNAKKPMIVVGGGAQDASPEVTALAEMLCSSTLFSFYAVSGGA